jgi:predicted membrane-bound spermidine synthase
MNLVVVASYDPRQSTVASTVSRWFRAVPPLVAADNLAADVTVIDNHGNPLQVAAPTYSLDVALIRATGQVWSSVTPGQVSSPTLGQWAFTLPVSDHQPITQPTEMLLDVAIVGPYSLRQTIVRQSVQVLPAAG